jgi:Do/DeqQ family serine protease
MQKNQFFLMFLAALMGGMMSLGAYLLILSQNKYASIEQYQQQSFSRLLDTSAVVPKGLNFLYASKTVSPAVVHIKTTMERREINYDDSPEIEDMIRHFHGGSSNYPPRQSSGSGVIISDDGYIATNYHVISEAGKIEVVLNDKRSYEAQLIGKDPATDLALLKISAKNLPFIRYGDSESLQVGEWVLAIGNPFDLTSTVTAGIVSAKGRSINLLKDQQYAIESFIQTDAAVNPGNSGGALVNLKGELIGINTAIATQTGYYAGYSFAVPINLVKKVMNDLMSFGEIQRAILGVSIQEVDAALAQEMKLTDLHGVYIKSVVKNGAANLAGIKAGDVIKKIDEVEINSSSELQTNIAIHHPGEEVKITYERNQKTRVVKVKLGSQEGAVKLLSKLRPKEDLILGAKFRELDVREKKQLGLDNGVKVVWLGKGKFQKSGIKQGFIITKINDQSIQTISQLTKIIYQQKKLIALDGVYPNGKKDYYAVEG